MPKQGLAKRVWNAMKSRKQPASALSDEDRRVMLAIAKLRAVGIVDNRVIHFKASVFLDAVFHTYKRDLVPNYAAALDKQEEVVRVINDEPLPLDEQYAIELARRALEPGGLEAAQSWVETVEAEIQGTPSSMYPNLIPNEED